MLPLVLFFAAAAVPYDILITNGRIIDGTGSPWYAGDLAIRDGKVAAIGHLAGAAAKRTFDARQMVVAPGFIDMLGQSEVTILVNPHLPSKIFQGITTEVTGEGGSVAPLNDAIIKADRVSWEHYGVKPTWRTYREYFARLRKQGIGTNVADYVGATQIRRMVIGDDNRDPTAAELERMKALVREAMRDGAIGLSTSLQYAPAPYAKTEELIALAAEAAKAGGTYASHIRDEGNGIAAALDEAFRIGREARIPVEIWHLKAAGKSNWGRMPEIVGRIAQARREGIDVAADTYAYTAAFNTFSAFIPPWAHDGGDKKMIERLKDPAVRERIRKELLTPASDWNNEWQQVTGPEGFMISAVQNPKLLPLQGKTIAEIAKLWNKDPIDTAMDIVIQDEGFTMVGLSIMDEPDVALALQQPWVGVCNDSQGTAPDGVLGREHPHPRAYGTFPRILRKYVREEHKLTLEDAIRKFTSLPAQRMRFADRGVLKTGLWADVVVFDPETIRDLATFDKPNQLSEGMRFVLVNGIPVIEEGKPTNALPGKVITR